MFLSFFYNCSYNTDNLTGGDVDMVLNSVNISFRDVDNIIDQINERKINIFGFYHMKIFFIIINENAYLQESKTLKCCLYTPKFHVNDIQDDSTVIPFSVEFYVVY